MARELLGCFLVRKTGPREIRAMITDVEAYVGEDDLACHASKGRTPRSEVLYGPAGRAYVYLIYGMYHIMNVVTERKDFPAAVMIRAVKIEGVDYKNTNGPGKVCREMKIDKKFHGRDITQGKEFWIEARHSRMTGEKDTKIDPKNIVTTTRVGVAYAGRCALYPWRFAFKEFTGKK